MTDQMVVGRVNFGGSSAVVLPTRIYRGPDPSAMEARAVSAETKITEARAILADVVADEKAMNAPFVLADAVCRAFEALGGFE